MLAPFWDPFGAQFGTKIVKYGVPLSKGGGPWNRLGAQGAQGRHQTPEMDQNGSQLVPKTSKSDPNEVQTSI